MENLQVLRRWKTTIHSNIPNIRTQFSTYHSIERNTWVKHSQSFISFEARRKLKYNHSALWKTITIADGKLKDKIKIIIAKFCTRNWTLRSESKNQHFTFPQHLDHSNQQSACCGNESDKYWQDTDKILTNKLQSPRVEDKRTTDKSWKWDTTPSSSSFSPSSSSRGA